LGFISQLFATFLANNIAFVYKSLFELAYFGASPGTTMIFNPTQLGKSAMSTHYLSPRVLVDMINAQIDVEVLLIGIQPAQVHLGKPLSPEVAQAVSFLANTIVSIFGNRRVKQPREN
jgi:hydrogenase maturation protease